MSDIIIASNNPGKIHEFERLFKDFNENFLSLKDFPDLPEVEETGTTFEENARLKAETIAALTGKITISDDSGLMVDALEGHPGVYSARFAGVEKDDEANLEKVLDLMKGVPEPQRTAQFITVLAVAAPGKTTRYFHGTCSGRITSKKRGREGFGYDPIFFVEDLDKTFAEMTREEKNVISHRGKAMKKLKDKWKTVRGNH